LAAATPLAAKQPREALAAKKRWLRRSASYTPEQEASTRHKFQGALTEGALAGALTEGALFLTTRLLLRQAC
jgi:hypothetical protein